MSNGYFLEFLTDLMILFLKQREGCHSYRLKVFNKRARKKNYVKRSRIRNDRE